MAVTIWIAHRHLCKGLQNIDQDSVRQEVLT
jgi:hypothetical protein